VTWKDYFESRILNNEAIIKSNQQFLSRYTDIQTETEFYKELTLFALSQLPREYFERKTKEFGSFAEIYGKVYSSLEYLELKSPNTKLKHRKALDAFALMMEEKLKLQEWEKDLVFMQNEFKIQSKNGRITHKKYDLIVFGKHNNHPYSAVSMLVSFPCAIVTQLMLDDKIKERGVLRPISEVVINGVLDELEKERIYVSEHIVKQANF